MKDALNKHYKINLFFHHRNFVMSTGYLNETGIDLGSFEITCFKGSNTITAHPDSCYEVVTNDIGKKSFPLALI